MAENCSLNHTATATYRLLPHIVIRKPIPSHLCEKFHKCFSPGVIEVKKKSDGEKEVVVANPRLESMSREVYRHSEFDGMVELTRIRDFFLCEFRHVFPPERPFPHRAISFRFTVSIESTGAYPPQDLLPESIRLMREKVRTLKRAAEALKQAPNEDEEMEA